MPLQEVTMANDGSQTESEHQHRFHIQIDRAHYEVTQPEMTGSQLRQVPATPIPSDRDLFEVVPGGHDRKIEDADKVKIHDGQRFFTAPTVINPGSGHKNKGERT
jgi:hypothetical protein